jgi:hypothetical protein
MGFDAEARNKAFSSFMPTPSTFASKVLWPRM